MEACDVVQHIDVYGECKYYYQNTEVLLLSNLYKCEIGVHWSCGRWVWRLLLLCISTTTLTHLPLMPHICVNQPVRRQAIVNWTPGNIFQWNLNRNSIIFIQENAIENVVCAMAAILFRWRWVNGIVSTVSIHVNGETNHEVSNARMQIRMDHT